MAKGRKKLGRKLRLTVSENEYIEIQAIFYGRVQGVFFRATARQIAQRLGLTGLVKNLDDGSVEVVAQGSEEKLLQLVQELKLRYQLDSEKPVKMSHREPHHRMRGFQIVF